jgi:hypothetical protein
VITVLQRVCWNDKSWKAPSGKTFDSGNPGKHGFGNEEWNFCIDDAMDGNVFGWLYWQAKGFHDEHMEILFWTIPPSGKEWLVVGAYHGATLATQEDLRKLESFFDKNGVYERRWAEVLNVVEDSEQKNYVKKHPPASAMNLRFKCPVEKVEIFQPYRTLPRKLRGRKIGARFKNPNLFEKPIAALLGVATVKSRPQLKWAASPLLEDIYPRATPASLKMIAPRHKELCNAFIRWLQRTGRTVVAGEKNRVDVEFRDGRSLCRAELKACYGMTTTLAIREPWANFSRIQLLRLAQPGSPVVHRPGFTSFATGHEVREDARQQEASTSVLVLEVARRVY